VAGLALGTAAMSLVGTLFAAMLMNARMKEVLLPLVTFPVLVPVVIGGVKVTAASLGAGPADDGASWMGFLGGFDAVCAGVSVWLFERMARS
jgi:ABC-type transport system involved in cytochrome c biogenesis permease component